ncbi:MAG: alpha/beta hydrolase [Paenibacillaceae bacterium]|nr:MAG: alpha/beta hydrolase [Paenibacillaceae bacterium]
MSKTNILPDLLLRSRNRRRNAKLLRIDSPDGIAEYRFVDIGGIKQWVTIRGEDRRNPVLLFVHGGPASPYSVFSPLLREWEKHFTLVQWDQRGAGKTFRRSGKTAGGSITLEQLARDGIELSEYLLERLGKRKIILIGSSVGSLIAMMMVRSRPDLYLAYVGTDQNAPDPGFDWYGQALAALRAAGIAKGIRLLERMGPDPARWKREDYDRLNQHLVRAIRGVPNMIMDLMLPSMLASPDHTIGDLVAIFRGMTHSLDHLFDELMTFDFSRIGTAFDVPFFIFQGDTDLFTPFGAARSFFDRIEAPRKSFAVIRNAGHLACFARPGQFLEELVGKVLPLAGQPSLPADAGRGGAVV